MIHTFHLRINGFSIIIICKSESIEFTSRGFNAYFVAKTHRKMYYLSMSLIQYTFPSQCILIIISHE